MSQVWAGVTLTFTAATSWTVEHSYDVNPYVGVQDADGNVLLVAPDYEVSGEVTIHFDTATAGTITLIGPDENGGYSVPATIAGGLGAGPWRNARLIEIRLSPSVDENGDQSGLGDLMWAGQAFGYLKRDAKTVMVGGNSVDVDRDLLWITDLEGVPIIETPGARWKGSQITVDDLRGPTAVRRRFTVKHMEHRAAGLAVDNLKLELATEVVV